MMVSDCLAHCLEREYPQVAPGDEAQAVLETMLRVGRDYLPVIRDGRCVAMASLRDLELAAAGGGLKGRTLAELDLPAREALVPDGHLYAFFAKAVVWPDPVIPVGDAEGVFVGVVRKGKLLERMSELFHLGDECMTLELEVPAFGLRISEIIGTLEKNDATVLSMGSYRPSSEGEGLVLVFRLHVSDPYRLVKNIEKYGYVIRHAAPYASEADEELRSRAEEFIRFLDL